jgi:hypothetical protein
MLDMYLVFSALLLLLMIGALADIITRDADRVRHLPKMAWVIIVILIPLVGSILWFLVGHEYAAPVDRGTFGDPRRWEAPEPVVRDTEAELAALEREIEESEKADRIRRLEAELEEKRRASGDPDRAKE